ncbi:MAG: DEAD/DEAH box helicase [Candidatus Sericytochromatia bacterium]
MNQFPFAEWELREELISSLAQQGITEPTPVQVQAFSLVNEGHDLLVQSRTGTGKTLAFGLPLLQRLAESKEAGRALVVLPTRELAIQVASVLERMGRPVGLKTAALFGGGSYSEQLRALNGGARIIVGTPGRLCDHLERGSLKLADCRALVLDEADEMLDMGFAEELDRILQAMPEDRQSLFFSATMAPEMQALARKALKNPKTLSVSSGLTTAPEIQHVAYELFREHRADALVNILHVERPDLAIVFCHTKAETEELAGRMQEEGIKAAFLNGDMAQAERTRTLNAFRRRQINLLVATDVAARGIDVKGITHVFNLGVPQNPETYVHRVGRTGRAGAAGQAITFVQPRDAARFRRMLQQAGVNIAMRQVPQAEDVRKRLRESFHEAMTTGVAANAGDGMRGLAEELLAYIEPMDLVATLLQRDRGARAILEAGLDVPVPRNKPMESRREVEPRPKSDRERGPREGRKLSEHHEPGMTRIHLTVGKANKLAPGTLVKMVCGLSGLKGEAIGAIAIHAHFCFFDVKEKEADRVISLLNGYSFQGRRLKANLVPAVAAAKA